jgi:hypothetical protein
VAVPVFPSFSFRHSAVFVGTHAGIKEPRDLVGRRMGVPKDHMAAAVWIRGTLEDEYFPYGVARNGKTLETLAGYTFKQGLAPRRLSTADMFCESTLGI